MAWQWFGVKIGVRAHTSQHQQVLQLCGVCTRARKSGFVGVHCHILNTDIPAFMILIKARVVSCGMGAGGGGGCWDACLKPAVTDR